MKSILLIEDNPLLMELYRTAFEEQKINVYIAHEGETGLKIAKKYLPDLILLDLLMVGIDGFEVLKKLKQNRSTKNIKVIILSLVHEQASKERVKALGAESFLLKNELTTDEIVKTVLAYLKIKPDSKKPKKTVKKIKTDK